MMGLGLVALLVDRIFRGRALERGTLLWVDVLVILLRCAAALVTALLLLAVLACITLVLRSLLRQAITMRAELEVVI